jgi:hypothetical protein
VTDIEQILYDAPVVTVGITTYSNTSNNTWPKMLDAVDNFGLYGQSEDAKANIIPIVNYGTIYGNGSKTYSVYRFYDGNNTAPAALQNFTALKLVPTSDNFAPKTMWEWVEETSPNFAETTGLRERFWLIPLAVNKEALNLATKIFESRIYNALSSLELWIAGWSPIPVSPRFLNASTGPNGHGLPDGDPMGAEPVEQYWIDFALSYANVAAYEEPITAFLTSVDAEIRTKLREAGHENALLKFFYLNDVDKSQEEQLWAGYPKKNILKLQEIRQKYDPESIVTDQMPGGWKVANAKV